MAVINFSTSTHSHERKLWVIKMKVYLKGLGLWEVEENECWHKGKSRSFKCRRLIWASTKRSYNENGTRKYGERD